MSLFFLIRSVTFCSLFLFFSPFSQACLWHQIAPRITTNLASDPSQQDLLRLCASNALQKHGTPYPALSAELLQALDSLRLFPTVMNQIVHTHLHFGYFAFAKNLTQAANDSFTLEEKQRLVSFLSSPKNKGLLSELEEQIKNISSCETSLLWNFYPQKQTLEPIENILDALKKIVVRNRYTAEGFQRLGHLGLLTMASALIFENIYCFDNLCRQQKAALDNFYNRKLETYLTFKSLISGRKYPIFKSDTYSFSFREATVFAAITVAYATYQCHQLAMATKKDFDNIYENQKFLISLRQVVLTTQKIVSLLEKNPTICMLIPEFEKIQQLAHYSQAANTKGEISTKLATFLNLLNSKNWFNNNSFEGDPSYYISWQGKIVETMAKFNEIKTELIPYFQALGNIDAQISTAKLLSQEYGQFCLPTWINTPLPTLQAVDFWHPAIAPNKAVVNTMLLDGRTGMHNVIITGSNAGGKTTALTAIMIGQIMAQSIGVAPANRWNSTPFAKFHTYLDISTNLADNESLFMAQANRAEKLQASIASCVHNEKALSILDEIFTGTRADFAEQASFEFAQKLAGFNHSMCLLATHFPKMTLLESLGLFINYRTSDATISNEGSLIYPYKISPGISTQNIAKYILSRKGLLSNLAAN